jgi:hypothetical protein
VYQEQSATIALPAGLVPHTPVMVRVVSAAGTDVVLVTRAMPRQVLHVRYTWQGQGELQIWMGGRQTQSLALPVEAPRG